MEGYSITFQNLSRENLIRLSDKRLIYNSFHKMFSLIG